MAQVISNLLSLLFITNFLIACNYISSRDIQRPTQNSGDDETPQLHVLNKEEESTQLNFEYIYTRIIEPKCTICHGTSGKIQLESYDDILKNLRRIKNAVFIKKSMPKLVTLTESEERLLWNWLQLKAPYYSKDTPPELSPLVPTFDSIYERIFINRCIICHNPKGKAHEMPLDKKTLLNSRYGFVVPGEPDKSSLVLSLEQNRIGEDKFMPPPSYKGLELKKLSPEEISVIKTWIANGAKD